MNAAHLTRLWTAVGLLLLFYALNSWIAGQGGQPILDAKLIVNEPVTSALIALVICPPLLVVLCWVGILFARLPDTGTGWHQRLPVIGLPGLLTGSIEGRLYQAFFLLVMIGLPCAALIYFLTQVLSARVFQQPGGAELGVLDPVDLHTLWSGAYWDDGYRLGESLEKSVTWFPVVEPIVIGIILLITTAHVIAFLWNLFRAPS